MIPAEPDPTPELERFVAACTAETFRYLCEPDKADWLVAQVMGVLPLPPHAAKPLATYGLKLLAQLVDDRVKAGAGWMGRKAAGLALAILHRLPGSALLCGAVADKVAKLEADARARDAAERAIAAGDGKITSEDAKRLSLDLRAGLRELQEIAELHAALDGIEAAIAAEHADLKDYLSAQLNPQPPLHLPIVDDDYKARFVFRARHVPFLGRAHELAALHGFLDHPDRFRWWLATGPAGTGKSRLALELCLRAPRHWHTGFLAGDTGFDRFEHELCASLVYGVRRRLGPRRLERARHPGSGCPG